MALDLASAGATSPSCKVPQPIGQAGAQDTAVSPTRRRPQAEEDTGRSPSRARAQAWRSFFVAPRTSLFFAPWISPGVVAVTPALPRRAETRLFPEFATSRHDNVARIYAVFMRQVVGSS
jgi:hypothetical protein